MIATQWVLRGTNTGTLPDGTPATGRTVTLAGATFTQIEGDKIRSEQVYFGAFPPNETFMKQCSCENKSDYNHEENTDMHRHEKGCALAPDLTDWLPYPHDGGLENGGVYVNPADTSVIYLLEDGYLCRTPREVEEVKEWVAEAKWVAEAEFDRYLEAKESSFI